MTVSLVLLLLAGGGSYWTTPQTVAQFECKPEIKGWNCTKALKRCNKAGHAMVRKMGDAQHSMDKTIVVFHCMEGTK